MSYIHEALKKAQKEKESLAGKCTAIWPGRQNGRISLHGNRTISLGIVVIAVAFSVYSWLQSIDSLPTGEEQRSAVYRGAIKPPSTIPSSRPAGPVTNSTTAKSIQARRPAVTKDGKPSQEILAAQRNNQSALTKKPEAPSKRPPSDTGTELYQQALALQKEGKFQEATALYKAVLKRSPNLVSALNNLGTIYIREKNLPEARKVLEKAIRTDVGYVDPYYNLACLHAQQKDIGRSLFYLKKAISVDEAARQWAKTDEDLKNLRGHVEYENIIKGAQNP